MDTIKEWIYVVITMLGVGTAWGDNLRRTKYLEKRLDKMDMRQDKAEDDHKNESLTLLTVEQHDRLQRNCQQLWTSELRHIRDLLENLKQEIRRSNGHK